MILHAAPVLPASRNALRSSQLHEQFILGIEPRERERESERERERERAGEIVTRRTEPLSLTSCAGMTHVENFLFQNCNTFSVLYLSTIHAKRMTNFQQSLLNDFYPVMCRRVQKESDQLLYIWFGHSLWSAISCQRDWLRTLYSRKFITVLLSVSFH